MWKNLKEKFLLFIIPNIIAPLIWVLGRTIRFKEIGNTDQNPNFKKNKIFIYAFWHNRILMSVYFYKRKNIHVLVSQSKDGEYIHRIIKKFGFDTIRGSTSKGGATAVIKMADLLKNNTYDIAITPDGPRGPKEKVQMGVIHLAKLTGFPIIPFSFNASKKIVLNSWDNFIIPLPFSRGIFIWGNPILVPENSTQEILEKKQQELENILKHLTHQAENYF